MPGQKLGWLLGGVGAFCWVPVLSIVLFVQGFFWGGILSLITAILAIIYILVITPWRFPDMPFWKLYLGIFLLFMACATVIILFWQPEGQDGPKNLWMLACLLPLLTPFLTMGGKTWRTLTTPPQGTCNNTD